MKIGKLHQTEFVFLFLVCLGVFQIFFIAINTGLLWRIILAGRWISKFGTMLENYSLKVFTNSLSSDTTFSFSFNIILSSFNVLSVRHGFTVFQNCLLSVTRLRSSLLNFFLVFRSSLIQIFGLLLYAICDYIVLSCLNLFNKCRQDKTLSSYICHGSLP